MRYQVVESPNALQDSTAGSPRKPPRLIPSVDARLDSLEPRLSRFYVQLLVLTGASWAIQAAELVLLVFTRVLVANDIGMGTPVLEIFGASIFMGSMAGGPIFGHIADKFGRRTALLIAMVFSLGGLAVLARANAQYMLIIGRVVVGIGLGGQLSSTVVLVHELSPQSTQGRVVSLLDAFTGVGGLVGVVLAYAVAPWLGCPRTTYLVVCGLVVYTVVLRVAIPESPRWLASVGRTEEAHAVVDKIECSHHFQPPYQKEVLDFTSVLEPPSSSATPPSSLFKRMLPSIVLWTLWIAVTLSAYALGIYVPTLISLNGYNMFGSWGTMVVLSVAQILGSVSAAMVLVSRDPQHALAGFAVLAAIVSVVLSYVSWSRGLVVTGSFLATALLSGCWSCVLAYTPGHYKNARRGRGVGYAVGVSRLAAVGGCYLYPHMFNVWILSVPALCWIFGGLLTVVSVGLVPRFGYQPLNQDDDSDSSVWMCEANLELDAKSSDSEERSIVTDTGDSNTLEETVSVNVR
ncbi:hypothetical protein PF002_g24961 [Phytophthora fragariae]|uniref:Major facilitator superfamily (MFS) profile domain-containing protein n=1 Tax=Phytophthora fragariae TaxID=53985 RepID=A0A6A3WVE6_9STRA|nr:hypothetical protein PF009_g24815 [Phytophthora fragariae]KAE9098879.1 hypothetical protein PF006_g23259 [Phytophthora fragariae]KAE9187545.1 hypothetical protein PF004_g22763 [Phytophthora fragariae]KAE9189741.1 hypothetical protein PF002_g24961 [Phytophthora fragariae]KAE9282749.1 hypothetical protein PF001_g23157 [Phytophthora fragariae]